MPEDQFLHRSWSASIKKNPRNQRLRRKEKMCKFYRRIVGKGGKEKRVYQHECFNNKRIKSRTKSIYDKGDNDKHEKDNTYQSSHEFGDDKNTKENEYNGTHRVKNQEHENRDYDGEEEEEEDMERRQGVYGNAINNTEGFFKKILNKFTFTFFHE